MRGRLEEAWPAIHAKARAEGAEALFADQAGIRSDQVTGRTRGEKGRTRWYAAQATASRSTPCPPSAPRAGCTSCVFTEIFDAKVMCRFLDRFAGHFGRKVHLVEDRHSAHRSRRVSVWLADHTDQVELHFLPAYSPELNPDEPVNTDLKRSLPMRHRARNQSEPAAEARRFFHRRQRQPHIVRGYFHCPQVRYTLNENQLSF
ncbi:transposase [Kitasatospora sp. KL5]|uniref:transposase n=1 Tax=Kitasatospora sp. KL5 TaxID=3425125 RepID=UPI003D701BFE